MRIASTVAPALAGEPGSRGVLVLRDYDDPAAPEIGQESPGADPEPALPGTEVAGVRRGQAERVYQHWCVSLWETRQRMEESNELALRAVLEGLSDLIPRGWRVNRSNYEGTFLL